MLGAPPSDFIVPWSDASIRGHALERVLTQAQIRRVEARVARVWPPGPHALGAAAARVVEALVTSARRAPSVLAVLGGEFGARNRVGIVPCQLSPAGIAIIHHPAIGGIRGGFRSSVTNDLFCQLLKKHNLKLIHQFDSFGKDEAFSVQTYGDMITVFGKMA